MASSSLKIRYGAAAILAAAVLFDIYARSPANFDVTPLSLDSGTRTAVLVLHGSNGREEPTLIALTDRLRELAGERADTAIVRYIWSPWSDARFRAGANGERVGEALGAELVTLTGLDSVHLIGSSAGAFVMNPLCETLKAASSRTVKVTMTYLDPMGIHGAFDFGWGARTYGTCADYAEAYVNTDDFVPGTNSPLEHAWNVDVTEAGKASGFTGGGHRWPIQYYVEKVTAADLDAASFNHAKRPRGVVVRP